MARKVGERSSETTATAPEADDLAAGTTEHYRDAVLYDYEYRRRRRDARFYTELATRLVPALSPGRSRAGVEGAPEQEVLELACGTGRVTEALARAGHRVVGVDLSPSMLARARARLGRMSRARRRRVHLVCADVRRLPIAGRFPLVVMAFNSFEHLYDRHDVAACLAGVRAALAPGGLFAFDVQLPDLVWLARSPTRRWARTVFRHPETNERLVYTTNHIYDPISQVCLVRIYYRPFVSGPGSREHVVRLSQRKYFPAELEALLDANGFEIRERFGDFAGEPLAAGAENQVLLCAAR
jgi:SAM-dependent methyltransferase